MALYGNYRLQEILGTGTYGIVHKCKTVGSKDGKTLAVKLIKVKGLKAKEKENLKRELNLMKKVKHEYIVKLIDCFLTDDQCQMCIVMEFCAGGTLKQYVDRKKGHIKEDTCLRILRQLCEAVQFLYLEAIIHRDIKTTNVLLTNDKTVKLADFGVAKIMDGPEMMKLTYFLLTPNYMSPEMVLGQPYDYKLDMWGIGICLYEMMTKKLLFDVQSLPELKEEMIKYEEPDTSNLPYSKELVVLLKQLLRKESIQRPTPLEMLLWIKNVPQQRFTTAPTSGSKYAESDHQRHGGTTARNVSQHNVAATRKSLESSQRQDSVQWTNTTFHTPQVPPRDPYDPNTPRSSKHLDKHSQTLPYTWRTDEDKSETSGYESDQGTMKQTLTTHLTEAKEETMPHCLVRHIVRDLRSLLCQEIEGGPSLISLNKGSILERIERSWNHLEKMEHLANAMNIYEMNDMFLLRNRHHEEIDKRASRMNIKMLLIHIQKAMEILGFLSNDFKSDDNCSMRMRIFISVQRLARVERNLSEVQYGHVNSVDDEEEMLLLAVWRIRSKLRRLQRELTFLTYDDPSFREDKHRYTQKRLESTWTQMQEMLKDLSQCEKDTMKHQNEDSSTKKKLTASIRELQMARDLLLPEKDLPSEESTNITKLTEIKGQESDDIFADTSSKLQAACNQMTSISEQFKALKWAFVCEDNDVCQLLIKKGILLDMLDLIEIVEKAKDTVVFKVIRHLKENNRWKPQDSVASELFVSACKTEMYSLCDLLIQEGVKLDMFDFCQVVQKGSSESFISRVIQHQKETGKWSFYELEAGNALQLVLVYEKNDICEQMMKNEIILNRKQILLIVKNGSVTSIIRLIRYLKEGVNFHLLETVLLGAFLYEKDYIFEILISERVGMDHCMFDSLWKIGSKSMVIKAIKYMKEENEWHPDKYGAHTVLERAIIKGEEDLYDMLIRDGVTLTMYNLPVIVKKAPLIAIKKSIQHLKDRNMWDARDGSEALKWAFILEKDDVCELLIENKITLEL